MEAVTCPGCLERDQRIAALQRRVAQLEALVRYLLDRLGQNATNSGTPPSANPPQAPKPVTKKRTGRQLGAQPGHPPQLRRRSADLPNVPTKVTTDAAGRFRLTGIGRERLVAVLIEGPTIVTRQARIVTRREAMLALVEHKPSDPLDPITFMTYYGADFQHAAAPTKPIVGVVRDKDTKKPLAGVTIQSLKLANNPYHGENHIRTTTDAEGHYRLTGMPKGKGNKIMAVPGENRPATWERVDCPSGWSNCWSAGRRDPPT